MSDAGENRQPDIWRLRLAKGSAGSSGGEWHLYDSLEDLEQALYQAAVECEAHAHVRGRPTNSPATARRWSWFKKWWEANQNDGEDRLHVIRVVGVDHLINGDWVEVEWSISPPVLTLGGTP